MSQKNQNLENLIQKTATGSQNLLRRGSSLDTASLCSQRRMKIRKDSQYQSMIEDTSVDSDGSNMTSVTTTTTGELISFL